MDTADGPVRFRILAGAAHSWATLILESEPGAVFVYRMGTGELELIHRDAAEALIADRAYRPWLGSREWAALATLPVADVAAWPAAGAHPALMDMDGEHPIRSV